MSAVPQVLWTPDDVASRLSQLGLSVDVLRSAILDGYVAKLSCTANDPLSFAGTTFWARTTRGLRDQLIPAGWRKSDAGNFATVVSPDDSIAIVVSTGDEGTGVATRQSTTKFPKGPATAAAIEVNVAQGELFPLVQIETPEVRQALNAAATWFLLIALSTEGDRRVIRAELSLPTEYGDDGRVARWDERIILPEIVDSDDDTRVPQPGPIFDIDIVRRTG